MRILIISSNTAMSPYPVFPLGACMIAGALEVAGHEVRQFDLLQHDQSMDVLAREVISFAPGLIGISIRNIDNVNLMNEQHYINVVRTIVSRIREISSSKILLGGAGFSLIPELILERTGADYGIVGEGESLAVEFVSNASKGLYPKEKLLGPETRLQGGDICSPALDDAVIDYYMRNGGILPVQTKRGCAYKCTYCSYPILEGSRTRQRDPADVVDDLEVLVNKHKAKFIFFVDSVFNDDEGAYMNVVQEMARRGINVPWTGFFRPGGLNDETVELMKSTGLFAVEIGSDATSDTTLDGMRKGFTFDDVVECNELFLRHGIAPAHYFMFGGPGETEKTVQEGVENIKRLRQSMIFIFMGIRILPETQLARLAVEQKIVGSDDGLLDSKYYISPDVDRNWLEETLKKAFSGMMFCIFPPDSQDEKLRALHKMGFSGPLWDMLLRSGEGKRRTRNGG